MHPSLDRVDWSSADPVWQWLRTQCVHVAVWNVICELDD